MTPEALAAIEALPIGLHWVDAQGGVVLTVRQRDNLLAEVRRLTAEVERLWARIDDLEIAAADE